MKKYILGLLICCGAFVMESAAQPQVRMSSMRHEFGTVLWHEPEAASFEVTNAGSSDLYIIRVHPDCGCTKAEWTKEAIRPGETGTIRIELDAELLGHFEKQVEVLTNADAMPFYLTLNGDVVRERRNYSGAYPYQVGELHLSSDNVEFDDVRAGQLPTRTLLVFNAGRQSYTPELMHLPKYLTMTAEPEIIRPGRVGKIHLTLDSEKIRTLGLTQTSIYLSRYAGDRVSTDNEIFISTTLLPEIRLTAAQMEQAPVAELDSTTLNLGKPEGKKKLKGKLVLRNTGRSDLEISALQVYNPGLGASIGKRSLKPGHSADLKITVNPNSEYFKGRRSVLLITNDPRRPKIVVDVIIQK